MGETPASNRREFLSGRALQRQVEAAGEAFANELLQGETADAGFCAGPTVSLGKEAMACLFEVLLNPGPGSRLMIASEVLDLVDQLEDQMSVYRPETELSRLNRTAAEQPIPVESRLFNLLEQARDLSRETRGAFDPTSGPLIALWRHCKQEERAPSDDEILSVLGQCGMEQVDFDPSACSVHYQRPGLELNLGAIGKGYALDRGGKILDAAGIDDWLFHGGLSSILARGTHAGHPGWPIGLRHPLAPQRTLATLILKNQGMGTSGSGTKFFRVGGVRYGHILDPRIGWPIEGMLSVTVLAPTAAWGDALSTAFFVLGVENSLRFCHNHPEVKCVLIPLPPPGRRLQPVVIGIPEEEIVFASDVSPTFLKAE